MPDPVDATYDRLAEAYARELWQELDGKPVDRWLLSRVVQEARGPILDVGCGPGHLTAWLAAHGAAVTGIDLSPRMIEVARSRSPGLSFLVGDFTQLPVADGSQGAVVAMYALVHTPRGQLGRPIAALTRALAPGGLLLVALHEGAEDVHPDALWGIPIDLTWHFHPAPDLLDAIDRAGLERLEFLVRWPYPEAEHPSRRVYALARKPTGA